MPYEPSSNAGGGGLYIARNGDYNDGGHVIVSGNQLINNTAGGLLIMHELSSCFRNVTLQSNIVQNNIGYGCAMLLETRNSILINNIVTDNTVDMWNVPHAAVTIYSELSAKIINNTITGNVRTNEGGGGGGLALYLLGDLKDSIPPSNQSKAMLYNNIIWGNKAKIHADIFIDNDTDNDAVASPVELLNNDFDPARPSGFFTKRYFPIHASNLKNVVPGFVAPEGLDYHLKADSPVIDKGNNNAPALPKRDFEGNSRVIGAAVDMGADECEP